MKEKIIEAVVLEMYKTAMHFANYVGDRAEEFMANDNEYFLDRMNAEFGDKRKSYEESIAQILDYYEDYNDPESEEDCP